MSYSGGKVRSYESRSYESEENELLFRRFLVPSFRSFTLCIRQNQPACQPNFSMDCLTEYGM